MWGEEEYVKNLKIQVKNFSFIPFL
jgi:hypothetical protein